MEPRSPDSPDIDDDDDGEEIPAIRPGARKGRAAEQDAEQEDEEDEEDEEDGDDDELSGYLSLAWSSGGVAAGGAAADTPSMEGELFLHKPMKWADLSFYVAAGAVLGEDSEDSWIEANLVLTRDLSDELSIGIGLNNYYFPNDDESPRMIHEIALLLDYDRDRFGAELEIDQQYATGASYTYLSASILHDFSLMPRLTITPAAEMTAILASGDFFETSGLETFSSGADISYEFKDSVYLSLSAIYEVDVTEDPWIHGIEYVVGVRTEF